MKKNNLGMKRFLGLVLAVIMVFSLFPQGVLASEMPATDIPVEEGPVEAGTLVETEITPTDNLVPTEGSLDTTTAPPVVDTTIVDTSQAPPAPATYAVQFFVGDAEYHKETVEEGKTIATLPATPKAEEGFVFTGWRDKNDASARLLSELEIKALAITKDTKLEVVFSKQLAADVLLDDFAQVKSAALNTHAFAITTAALNGVDVPAPPNDIGKSTMGKVTVSLTDTKYGNDARSLSLDGWQSPSGGGRNPNRDYYFVCPDFAFSADGFTQIGWTYKGASVVPGEYVKYTTGVLSGEHLKTQTLTAVWEANSGSVTVDYNATFFVGGVATNLTVTANDGDPIPTLSEVAGDIPALENGFVWAVADENGIVADGAQTYTLEELLALPFAADSTLYFAAAQTSTDPQGCTCDPAGDCTYPGCGADDCIHKDCEGNHDAPAITKIPVTIKGIGTNTYYDEIDEGAIAGNLAAIQAKYNAAGDYEFKFATVGGNKVGYLRIIDNTIYYSFDGGIVGSPLGSKEVILQFQEKETAYNVTYVATPDASYGEVTGPATIAEDGTIRISVVAKQNYALDGEPALQDANRGAELKKINDNLYELSGVTQDVTVSAKFKQVDNYTVTFSNGDIRQGNFTNSLPSGGFKVIPGNSQSLTLQSIDPNTNWEGASGQYSDWHLDSLVANGIGLNLPNSYTIGTTNPSAVTTLPGGTIITVTLTTVTPVLNGNTYTYSVELTNVSEPVTFESGNFKAAKRYEILIKNLSPQITNLLGQDKYNSKEDGRPLGINDVVKQWSWTSNSAPDKNYNGNWFWFSVESGYTVKIMLDGPDVTPREITPEASTKNGYAYQFVVPKNIGANLKLHITAEKVKYGAKLALNDGTGNVDEIVPSTTEGESFNLPVVPPTRDGYVFQGWLGPDSKTYNQGDLFDVTAGNTSLAQDGYFHFTAQWKEKSALTAGDPIPVTIYYYKQVAGSYPTDPADADDSISVMGYVGENLVLLSDDYKAKYTADGFVFDESASTAMPFVPQANAENAINLCYCPDQVDVTFTSNVAGAAQDTAVFDEQVLAFSVKNWNEITTLPTPAESIVINEVKYYFTGWSGARSTTAGALPTGDYALSADETYTANYAASTVITITPDNDGKIYGEDDPDKFAVTITGGTLPASVTYDIARIEGEDVSDYSIIVSNINNVPPAYDIKAGTNGTFAITPATLTIKANDATGTVGDANYPEFSYDETTLLDGLQFTDTLAKVLPDLATELGFDTDATLPLAKGEYDITPVITDVTIVGGNYVLAIEDGTLTVGAAQLTVSGISADALNKSKVYDATALELLASDISVTANGRTVTSGYTLQYSTDGQIWTNGLPAGITDVADSFDFQIRVISTSDDYTNSDAVDASLTITKRPVAFSFESKAAVTYAPGVTYDLALLASTGTDAGLVSGQAVTAVEAAEANAVVSYSNNAWIATVGPDAGVYTATPVKDSIVIVDDETTANYDISVAAGGITINKASLNLSGIEIADAKKVYGENDPEFGFTNWPQDIDPDEFVIAFSRTSGENVPLLSSGKPYITATVTPVEGGNYDVTGAIQTGGGWPWNPNPDNRGRLTITKREITIQTGSASKVYDGLPLTEKSYQITSALGLANNPSIGIDDSNKLDLLKGDLSLITGSQTNAGSSQNFVATWALYFAQPTLTTNYDITWDYGTLTVSKRPVTVVTLPGFTFYDGNKHALEEYYAVPGISIPGVYDSKSGLLTQYGHTLSNVGPSREVGPNVGIYGLDVINNPLKVDVSNAKVSGLLGLVNHTDNYEFKVLPNLLTIHTAKLELELKGYDGPYDGNSHGVEIVSGYQPQDGDVAYYNDSFGDGILESILGWSKTTDTWTDVEYNGDEVQTHAVWVKVLNKNGNIFPRCGIEYVTIYPREVTVQTETVERTYDGSEYALQAESDSYEQTANAGFLTSELGGITITDADPAYTDVRWDAAGTTPIAYDPQKVTVSFDETIAKSGNYKVAVKPGTQKILPINLEDTVTVDPYVGDYDGASHGVTVNGVPTSGVTVEYSATGTDGTWQQALEYKNVNRDANGDAQAYPVFVKVTGNNYTALVLESSVTINPLPLGISITGYPVYQYGDPTPATPDDMDASLYTLGYNGFIPGEDENMLNITNRKFSTTYRDTMNAGDTYGHKVDGITAINYDIVDEGMEVTIESGVEQFPIADIHISGAIVSHEYAGQDIVEKGYIVEAWGEPEGIRPQSIGTAATPSGKVALPAGDTIIQTLANVDAHGQESTVGTHEVTVTLPKAGSREFQEMMDSIRLYDKDGKDVTDNYSWEWAGADHTHGSLTITPAPLTVTAGNLTLAQGSPVPAQSAFSIAAYNGFKGNDAPANSLQGTPAYATAYTSAATAGQTFDINVSGLTSENYQINYAPGTLTVTAAADTTPVTPITPATPGTPGTPITPAAPAAAAPAADPAAPAPVVDITDTPVPQDPGDEPADEEEAAAPVVDIDDNDTPTDPGTASWALWNLILTILTGVIMLVTFIWYFVGKKKKDEEDDPYQRQRANSEQEDEQTLKRRGIIRLLTIIPTIVAIIVFILTEDMRLPMVMTDQYTIWMAVIAIVQVVLTVFTKKKRNKPEDEQMDKAQPQGF
ncbi:InlB B-repeat-containing protein [Christensenellaceae bacterium OttesenSCG-928-K19]|nr:InlB B-repeat-containing protein [Christensenellaceae bacterium OttesenSCG-928-K19]